MELIDLALKSGTSTEVALGDGEVTVAKKTFVEQIKELVNTYVGQFIIHLVIAVVVLIVGLKLVKIIITHIEKRRTFLKLESNTGALVINGLKVVLNVLVIIMAVDIIGVPSATIVTVLGSCGLAIGLALQGGLSNIAGGVMIMLFKPFKYGDYICTTAGDGFVEEIGLFYTKLLTFDKRSINIPNSILSSTTVTNYYSKPERGVDIDLSVAYGSDIEAARRVLVRCAEDNPLVLTDPAPKLFVVSHDDSCVKLMFRVFAKSPDYWAVKAAILEAALRELPKAGLEIPFPQVDVHIKN